MMKRIALLGTVAVLIVAVLVPVAVAQGSGLTAVYVAAPPTLDGDGGDAAWTQAGEQVVTVSGGKIGTVDVTLKAVYDNNNIYLLAQWPDATLSIDKNQWEFDGTAWSKSGNEDRLAILWDMGIAGFAEQGCLVACHADGMRTNSEGEYADEWHWKAARSNPMGFADDKYLDDNFEEGDIEAGHHGDGGDSTYADNKNEAGDGPASTWSNPADSALPPFAPSSQASSFLLRDDAADITVAAAGDKVPGYLLQEPSGSRADVKSVGSWTDGTWTLEFQRALNTGENATKDGTPVDVVFEPGNTYLIGVAVMDDTGANHSTNSGVVAVSFSRGPVALPTTGSGMGALLQAAIAASGLVAIGVAAYLRREH